MSATTAFSKDPEFIAELRANVMTTIQAVGYRLQLPQMTIATAMTLFHRFFAKESFESHDVFHIAKTCLFVAGKSEETPRRFRDVLNTAYRYRNPHLPPLEVSDEFWSMKERLFESERLLLRVLDFNVEVVHPHSFALHFLRDLKATDDLANLTVAILNDAARIPLCLYYEPHVIACSSLYLATELLSVRAGDGDDEWWDRFGAHRTEVETICHEMLDIYEQMDRSATDAVVAANLPPSPKIS